MPLWRSDYAYEATGMQNLTYGMAMWIPYFGDGTNALDSYSFHSQMAPAVSCIWDLRSHDLDYALLRRFLAQWRQVSSNYYGDYIPLTAYRTENDVWMAWQFNRPEAGEGMVQAFRRSGSAIDSQRFKLHDLDPQAVYRVRNLDFPNQEELTGLELMEQGLQVSLAGPPGSAVIVYQRL